MKKQLSLVIAFFAIMFSMNAQTVALTGGFNGWPENPTSNLFSTVDNVNYTLSSFTFTSNTDVKFTNGTWGSACGCTGSCFPLGTGIPNGGANIPVLAGTYDIAFNQTTKEFSFTSLNPFITVSGTATASTATLGSPDGIAYTGSSITLTSGDLTFAQTGSSNVWGNAAFPSGTATLGGTAIMAQPGTWNVTFNRNMGDYSFTPVVFSIIGDATSATPGVGWNTDIYMSTTDAINYTLNNLPLVIGELKFRDNSKWDVNQFHINVANDAFASGTATPGEGGNNWAVTTAGNYDITFNRSTYAYTILPAGTAGTSTYVAKVFNVSPNPSNAVWNFDSTTTTIESIQLYDVLGKLVLSIAPKGEVATIDATVLSNGIYYAKVASTSTTETIKLVKN